MNTLDETDSAVKPDSSDSEDVYIREPYLQINLDHPLWCSRAASQNGI